MRVLLFASYADAFGAPAIDVPVEAGATVAELVTALRAMSAASALPPAPLVAVNLAYAPAERVLAATDEIALIPPVAGG